MKRFMIGLLFAIPLTSVALGVVMIYLAVTSPDAYLETEAKPLSKTSWQETP